MSILHRGIIFVFVTALNISYVISTKILEIVGADNNVIRVTTIRDKWEVVSKTSNDNKRKEPQKGLWFLNTQMNGNSRIITVGRSQYKVFADEKSSTYMAVIVLDWGHVQQSVLWGHFTIYDVTPLSCKDESKQNYSICFMKRLQHSIHIILFYHFAQARPRPGRTGVEHTWCQQDKYPVFLVGVKLTLLYSSLLCW